MHFKVVFKPVCVAIALFGLLLFSYWGDIHAAEKDAMKTELVLPSEVDGWRWDGKEERYDSKTIFKYIDGAGEVYLAYGFKSLVTRRFERSGRPLLTADVYEMGSSADAYGVFSFERQDEEAGMGQGSEFGGGLLRFWKGNYFVSVNAEGEGEDVDKAILSLGRAVAALITKTGPRPGLISHLPGKGFNLVEKNVYFFRSHVLLNQRFFIAHQNILQLGPDVEAVLAEYRLGKEKEHLVLIRYPSEKRALDSLSSFRKAYLPEAHDKGIVKTEDEKWAGVMQYREFVTLVFGAPSEADADSLLKAAEINVKGNVQ
ncbi:MAG TPA: DUF6599 family protein [Syntrophorhabdales bacterium]|nr:DUF6599 family protein [Syntrophorhabdales bacterium]